MAEEEKSQSANGAESEDDSKSSLKLPDTLVIVLLLFPGFVTERVSEYFSTAPKLGDIQLVATALAATVINLLIALLIVRFMDRFAAAGGWVTALLARVDFLALVFTVSILTGIAWAIIDSTNVLFKLHLTQRASRADPWTTTFDNNARRDSPYFVRVITKDGDIYHGSPHFYSQSGGEKKLVLDLAQRELTPSETAKPRPDGSKEMRCVPVGVGIHGKVFIPGEQIIAVEFRPKTQVGESCEYRCDIPPEAKRCQ